MAAIIVVLHHIVLALPSIADAYASGVRPKVGSAAWLLTYTPLRLIVAGSEAVLVFFVLSGLVVALPVLRSQNFAWVNYYTSRALRLGLPVAAAVLLATLLHRFFPIPDHPSSLIVAARVDGASWQHAFRALDLIAGDYSVNNSLWSLRWEMIFSLALPLYVVIVVMAHTKLRTAFLFAGSAVLIWGAHMTGNSTFFYLPVFLLGTVLARLTLRRQQSNDAQGVFAGCGWLLFLVVSALALTLPWLVPWTPSSPEISALLKTLPPFGAAGIVWTTLYWRPLRAVFASLPFRIVGRYSFSLYLVHAPAIYLTLSLFPGLAFRNTTVVTLGIAAVLTVAFHHFIESPGHKVARTMGTRAMERYRLLTTPTGAPRTGVIKIVPPAKAMTPGHIQNSPLPKHLGVPQPELSHSERAPSKGEQAKEAPSSHRFSPFG